MFPIGDIEKAFNINILVDNAMQTVINKADIMYSDTPFWLKDNLKTLNFQRAIPSEVARLATLEIEVTV